MNEYEILGINKNASLEEIKKKYIKLVLKYHPDRNKDPNASIEFIKINEAYKKIIANKNININNIDNNIDNFYDNLKLVISKYPILNKIIDNLIDDFYPSYTEFITDINEMNFVKIYDTIIKNIHDKFNNKNLDIYGTIYTNLYDKYHNNYQKISIKRETKESIILYIPLRENYIIYFGEGECNNYFSGDILISIICNKENNYLINNNDLIYKNKNQDNIFIDHFGENLDISNCKIFINKGLPYLHDNILKRGNLYIM
jgi:curved DNA-binding protein CbpA